MLPAVVHSWLHDSIFSSENLSAANLRNSNQLQRKAILFRVSGQLSQVITKRSISICPGENDNCFYSPFFRISAPTHRDMKWECQNSNVRLKNAESVGVEKCPFSNCAVRRNPSPLQAMKRGKNATHSITFCLCGAAFELGNQLWLDEKMYTCSVRAGFKKVNCTQKSTADPSFCGAGCVATESNQPKLGLPLSSPTPTIWTAFTKIIHCYRQSNDEIDWLVEQFWQIFHNSQVYLNKKSHRVFT